MYVGPPTPTTRLMSPNLVTRVPVHVAGARHAFATSPLRAAPGAMAPSMRPSVVHIPCAAVFAPAPQLQAPSLRRTPGPGPKIHVVAAQSPRVAPSSAVPSPVPSAGRSPIVLTAALVPLLATPVQSQCGQAQGVPCCPAQPSALSAVGGSARAGSQLPPAPVAPAAPRATPSPQRGAEPQLLSALVAPAAPPGATPSLQMGAEPPLPCAPVAPAPLPGATPSPQKGSFTISCPVSKSAALPALLSQPKTTLGLDSADGVDGKVGIIVQSRVVGHTAVPTPVPADGGDSVHSSITIAGSKVVLEVVQAPSRVTSTQRLQKQAGQPGAQAESPSPRLAQRQVAVQAAKSETVPYPAGPVIRITKLEQGRISPPTVRRTGQLSPTIPRRSQRSPSIGAASNATETSGSPARRSATGEQKRKERVSLLPRKPEPPGLLILPKVTMIKDTLADEKRCKQYARECFDRFDKDGNRSLSFDELVDCMKHMNANLGIGEFRDRDVATYMRRWDINSDGHLSEQEFQDVYRHLLLVKLNEEEPTPFCRDMFVGRRRGQPSDHYEIQQVVGKGTFGVVSKVLCKESRAARVLKTVDKEAAMKSGLPPKLVMEEIDKLKALDHPAVLRLFEYYADAQSLHLITDHLPGGELSKAVEAAHINKEPLKQPWIRAVFHQVCEGVAYIHGKGVMHRDLKLDNIMLGSTEPPEAIIIDVGLAELFPTSRADTYHSSAPTGSIPTMAPEVLMQSSTYKCDVWSLGCCLFGLVCRTPLWFTRSNGNLEAYPYPFTPPHNDSRVELEDYLRRQKAGPDLSNTQSSSQPPSARDLIAKMLTFNEEARPAMKQVLAHPWLQDEGKESHILEPEQLDCLVNFQRTSAMEEAVLLDVASQLPLQELGDFRELFRQTDLDGDGKLDCRELAEAMQKAGLDPTPAQEAAKKFARVGPIEFSRFVAALVPSRPDVLMPYLRDAFNRLDTDGDGNITTEELRHLLEKSLKHAKASQAVSSMMEAFGGARCISFEALERHFADLSDSCSPSRSGHRSGTGSS